MITTADDLARRIYMAHYHRARDARAAIRATSRTRAEYRRRIAEARVELAGTMTDAAALAGVVDGLGGRKPLM